MNLSKLNTVTRKYDVSRGFEFLPCDKNRGFKNILYDNILRDVENYGNVTHPCPRQKVRELINSVNLKNQIYSHTGLLLLQKLPI